jgi:hypothetical protein
MYRSQRLVLEESLLLRVNDHLKGDRMTDTTCHTSLLWPNRHAYSSSLSLDPDANPFRIPIFPLLVPFRRSPSYSESDPSESFASASIDEARVLESDTGPAGRAPGRQSVLFKCTEPHFGKRGVGLTGLL